MNRLMGENCDDSALALGILARTVHIAVSQRDRLDSGRERECGQVVLRRKFSDTVGRRRQFQCRFGIWQAKTICIDGAARGGKDESLSVRGPDALHDIQEPVEVYSCILLWVSHRASDISL